MTGQPVKRTCAIVINYHGAEKTEKCLRSLLGQAVDTVILVDNSVSSCEAQALEKLVGEIRTETPHPAIRLVVNDENLGFGRAVNRAIRQDMESCGGHEFYMVINNDAEATPAMVERLVSKLEEDRGISLISPLVISAHGSMEYLWYNKVFGSVTLDKIPLSFPVLSGCCLLFRKSLVEKAPLFDEDFFMYGEDVDLCWRLQKNGSGILCCRDIPVHHEGTGSSHHGGFFYEYHVARGHVLLAVKTGGGLQGILLFLMGRVLYLSSRALIRTLRYRTLAPLLALLTCWVPMKVVPAMRESR